MIDRSHRSRHDGHRQLSISFSKRSCVFAMSNNDSGTEVIIQNNQGVEVQVLKSYGVGLDVHSQFIAVCVHVRNNNRVYKYMSDFDTDWNSLLAAKEWVVDKIKTRSAPVPDLSLPLHYVLEATSTYHMPVLRAWGGIPSVINPMLAGATKKKTDNLDAERLSFHDLTGVWPESFVVSDDLQELRVLIAERNHYAKLATQCSNRINNIIVRFGITIGRGTSTWLAFVGTPRRFPNAKALAAYCGLDPSLKVSAGHVTSTKKRGGCRTLHAVLVTSADRIIRAHTEAFGRWGFLMAKSSGKWKKATNAVGRKLCTAMYHMMMSGQEFSYENYTIMKDAAIFNIPVDELPMLNPDFKRYIRILHDSEIHTTTDMITAYLSCSLGGVKGLGRKFFVTMRDYLSHQHKYQNEYKKLHSTETTK